MQASLGIYSQSSENAQRFPGIGDYTLCHHQVTYKQPADFYFVKCEPKQDSIIYIGKQRVAESIRDFYKSYATIQTSAQRDALLKKYFTKGLIEKVERMARSTNVDPIIRAQDFDENFLKTLSTKSLGSNNPWYMMSYGEGKKTNIPVRVTMIKGQNMIDYITPMWNDSLYGDSLLCSPVTTSVIEASEPLGFLQNFYDVYTRLYASMPEGLSAQLETLRAQYLSPHALSQFKETADEQAADGWSPYDLLINDFDFDNTWRQSIKVTPLGKDTYKMSYTKWKNIHPALVVKVIKQGDKYLIDDISKL